MNVNEHYTIHSGKSGPFLKKGLDETLIYNQSTGKIKQSLLGFTRLLLLWLPFLFFCGWISPTIGQNIIIEARGGFQTEPDILVSFYGSNCMAGINATETNVEITPAQIATADVIFLWIPNTNYSPGAKASLATYVATGKPLVLSADAADASSVGVLNDLLTALSASSFFNNVSLLGGCQTVNPITITPDPLTCAMTQFSAGAVTTVNVAGSGIPLISTGADVIVAREGNIVLSGNGSPWTVCLNNPLPNDNDNFLCNLLAPCVDVVCPATEPLFGCGLDDINIGGIGTYSPIPSPLTEVEFNSLGGAIVPGFPPYSITYQDVVVSSICPIEVTRTFSITDASGSTVTCDQTITVTDNIDPVINCPSDIFIYLGSGECEKEVNWIAPGSDNCPGVSIFQTLGPLSGDILDPSGSPYFVEYWAIDACGMSAHCSFNIHIIENVPDENSLSCGDQINVSMDEDCQFYFTADYLLTGNDYHCFDDYDTYVMECHNCPPIPTSPIITPEYIGDTLVGKVCDPLTGICCWGYIVPEDKGSPSLCWADFSMSCTSETHPDSISGITKTYPYTGGVLPIPDASSSGPDSVCIYIDVECDTLPLIDLIVNLSITHPMAPGDLTAKIKNPGGDEASLSLSTPTTPAIPIGTNASGTWKITIYDNINNGSSGTVNTASLEIEANYAKPIPIDNCDSDMTPTWTDVVTDPNCDGDCYQTIIRTWCVTDDSGNEFCCDQIICLTRPSLDDLVCPPDYDGMDQPMLACDGGFPTDSNGHPDPSYTGRPTLEGFEVDGFCMLYCIYEDDSIDVCEGSYIIVREWECFDWCEGTDTTCTQIIKVMDNEGPDLVCPDSITLNAGYDCTAGTTLPPPSLSDVCSPSGVGYSAFLFSGGGDLVFSGGNWILSNVPIGTTTICYAAYDGCGNKDTCYFDVIVLDNTPPVAICETFHTVGIAGSPSWYNAIDFDDGSYDYCSPITYEVKRLENSNCDYPDGQETAFGPKVPFYCCDVGDTIEVILKITDAGGLMNFCISNVYVQDNVAPTHIDCPDEVEVDCTLDFYNPDNTGGEPTFFDNCNVDTIIITFTNPQLNCGRDTIYKKWVAIDDYGNKDSCEQTIIVVNNDPFDGTTDIDWPDHVIDPPVSCESSTHPDSLPIGSQRPILLTNNACDIVSIADPEDLIFYPVDPETADFCYKIKRTWEVIDWCFIDGTGNPAIYEYEQIIKVVDTIPPTFTCPDNFSVMFGDPVNVEVTNIMDTCTPDPADITVTYDIDKGNDGSFEVLGQLGPDASGPSGPATNYPEGTNIVRFIITDGCYQSDTCEVEVVVTSGPSATFNVSGGIENEEGNEVEYVDVEVEGDNMNDITTTGDDGAFSFNLQSNSNYAITPERDDNIQNGVSTYDLVLISKHILQYEMLSSPYKIIAADVNHSGSVSTLDMVALRRVILFIDDEFPNNTSWRFVDAEFVFPDPTDPFATSFPEVSTINGLTEDEVANFVGVKIGDVNISSAPNDLIGSGDDRNADGELLFTLADQSLIAGETYQFDFKATDFDQVQGFQFTMSYNENAIEFNDVEARDLANISDASFGLHKLNEGIITASWNASDESQSLENGKVLFSFSFTALEDGQLSELININSRFTKAEAYNHNGLLDLSLQFADESGTIAAEQFELYQNQPNPFKDETVIGFYLPKSGKATFKVFDISGRVIKSVDGDYSKGYNEISINRSELQSSGVLYYQLESADHIASKKMVLLD